MQFLIDHLRVIMPNDEARVSVNVARITALLDRGRVRAQEMISPYLKVMINNTWNDHNIDTFREYVDMAKR
jgi:hypothetical protein